MAKKVSKKEKKVPKKAGKKKSAAGAQFVKLSQLSKAGQKSLALDDLWVCKPPVGAKKRKARLCGCRNVCIA